MNFLDAIQISFYNTKILTIKFVTLSLEQQIEQWQLHDVIVEPEMSLDLENVMIRSAPDILLYMVNHPTNVEASNAANELSTEVKTLVIKLQQLVTDYNEFLPCEILVDLTVVFQRAHFLKSLLN